MARKQLHRKQRERLQHKQEILDIALQLFSERGFHNVSMQEIAHTSEFSVGTLYNFFESKDALFHELMIQCGEKIRTVMMASLEQGGDEVQKISNFILSAPEVLQNNAMVLKLYIAEFGITSTPREKEMQNNDWIHNLREKMRLLIQQGIEKKKFMPVDAEITAIAIQTTVEAMAFNMIQNLDDVKKVKDVFSRTNKLFLDGLLLKQGK